MATAYADFDQEAGKKFDALAKEIERCFDGCHSILEIRKNLLLEEIRQMKDVHKRRHKDIVNAMQQIEDVRESTNTIKEVNIQLGVTGQIVQEVATLITLAELIMITLIIMQY